VAESSQEGIGQLRQKPDPAYTRALCGYSWDSCRNFKGKSHSHPSLTIATVLVAFFHIRRQDYYNDYEPVSAVKLMMTLSPGVR